MAKPMSSARTRLSRLTPATDTNGAARRRSTTAKTGRSATHLTVSVQFSEGVEEAGGQGYARISIAAYGVHCS